MLPYFAITIPIAVMAVVAPVNRRMTALWALTFVAVLFFVGLRHHVGMDWNNYLIMISRANIGSLWESFAVAEPGYSTLLWISGQNGLGVYGAYFFGTLIFCLGLFRYAMSTPSPWISLLVAMPYLVIVISMSAARQAAAVGVLLWLVADWSRASFTRRSVLIFVAASLHISALGFFAFALLDLRWPVWLKTFVAGIIAIVVVYSLQGLGRFDYFDAVYISGQTELTESTGAIYHVIFNGAPAMLCFLIIRGYGAILPDSLHRNLAVLAILLIPLSLFFSTAASRITIYLFPVSMWFFAVIPQLIQDSVIRIVYKLSVATLFLSILGVWLSYGNASIAYQNYRNAIFVPSSELYMCCK